MINLISSKITTINQSHFFARLEKPAGGRLDTRFKNRPLNGKYSCLGVKISHNENIKLNATTTKAA
jgi:hypothetical protein